MFKLKIFRGSHASTKIFYLEFFYQWNIFCRKISELRYIARFITAMQYNIASRNYQHIAHCNILWYIAICHWACKNQTYLHNNTCLENGTFLGYCLWYTCTHAVNFFYFLINLFIKVSVTCLKVCSHYESNVHWKQINLHCLHSHWMHINRNIHIECAFSQSTSIGGLKPVWRWIASWHEIMRVLYFCAWSATLRNQR